MFCANVLYSHSPAVSAKPIGWCPQDILQCSHRYRAANNEQRLIQITIHQLKSKGLEWLCSLCCRDELPTKTANQIDLLLRSHLLRDYLNLLLVYCICNCNKVILQPIVCSRSLTNRWSSSTFQCLKSSNVIFTSFTSMFTSLFGNDWKSGYPTIPCTA